MNTHTYACIGVKTNYIYIFRQLNEKHIISKFIYLDKNMGLISYLIESILVLTALHQNLERISRQMEAT